MVGPGGSSLVCGFIAVGSSSLPSQISITNAWKVVTLINDMVSVDKEILILKYATKTAPDSYVDLPLGINHCLSQTPPSLESGKYNNPF